MKLRSHWLFFGLMLCITALQVNSHSVPKTTSELIIRDGQAELKVLVDIENWLMRLQDPQAWLLGDTEVLLTEAQLTSSRLNVELYKLLENGVELSINGKTIPLAPIKTADSQHSHVVEFRFSATHPFQSPQEIRIRFPKSLGDVHFSLSHPIYSQLSAGSAQNFSLQH
ncbi:hypothetical protein [Vibrio bivalvicida]|uniref:Uncharacterized protein n=1 Tax=Vibrio bivalvicida TaxID=1276888 RepID=A0ABV4MP12_9VIBR